MTFKILGDHSYITWALFVINHNIFTKIWASCAPTHFLANQLTLSQPGGAHYPHPVLCALPNFQTLRRPWKQYMFLNFWKKSGFLHVSFLMVEKFNGCPFLVNPKFNRLFLVKSDSCRRWYSIASLSLSILAEKLGKLIKNQGIYTYR